MFIDGCKEIPLVFYITIQIRKTIYDMADLAWYPFSRTVLHVSSAYLNSADYKTGKSLPATWPNADETDNLRHIAFSFAQTKYTPRRHSPEQFILL